VVKKDVKKSLKGVVVKKKPKAPENTQKKGEGSSKPGSSTPARGDDERPPAKKQKIK
jgi:hypothetical protein